MSADRARKRVDSWSDVAECNKRYFRITLCRLIGGS